MRFKSLAHHPGAIGNKEDHEVQAARPTPHRFLYRGA